jgi:CheY-like chemotaxis protein
MKPLSIVIADDVEEIRHLVRDWLGGGGHSVDCASGAMQLAKLLRQQHYDLVITDILMPDGDGLEVMTELKKTQPWARVLAISGGGAYLRAADCLNVAKGFGAHAVLLKPFNRQQLLEAVEKVSLPVPVGEA